MTKEVTHDFFIDGRLPGLNEYTNANRTNRFKASKMKKDTEEHIVSCIKDKLKGVDVKEPVFITYIWVEKNTRRDKDNIAFAKKFCQDSLVKAGVLKNDGWKNIIGFEDLFMVDKERPGVLVKIREIHD